jgi:hypothetical protein
MKSIKLLFLGVLLTSTSAMAQSAKYQKTMEANVAQLDTARSTETFTKLLNTFERVAIAEKTEWLPYYYAGYCANQLAYREKDKTLIDASADRADRYADKADSLSPNNSEVYCLKAIIGFGRIRVDMMSRGPKYGAISGELLGKAYKANPNNPRATLLIAQSKLNMPEGFGGDKAQGCQLIAKSLQLFAQESTTTIQPHWGKNQAESWAKKCSPPQTAQAAPAAAAPAPTANK